MRSEKQMSVIVFGSINIDLMFRVDRLPGLGETALGPSYAMAPGGKGANQALAAARAGSMVRLAGTVGADSFAEPALAELIAAGVDLSAVARVAAPTGCAAIGVDSCGRNQILVAGGANLSVHAGQVPDSWLGPDTILLLQMEVPWQESLALARRAKQRGARVALNLAPALPVDPDDFAAVDILVVNEHEASVLGKRLSLTGPAPQKLAQRLSLCTIVTLGERGAILAARDLRLRVPAPAIEAVDTTGAGDALVGALAADLDRGAAYPAALSFAVTAASLACLKRGAQTSLPLRAEIEARAASLSA
jgi:ribokinase